MNSYCRADTRRFGARRVVKALARACWAMGFGLVSLAPLAASLALHHAGKGGPSLLYITPTVNQYYAGVYESWRGRGALPITTWRSMQGRGRIVRFDGMGDTFYGGLVAEHGHVMLATGPECWSLAVAWKPGSAYPQYMRVGLMVPHLVGIISSALFCVFVWVAVVWTRPFLRWVRNKLARQEGHCSFCGYDLRGLKRRRCPECGVPFDPGE
jgi:hypothetical protein